MFVVDDVLFFPVHSLVWIFREIHRAAQEELVSEAEQITAQLSELYMMLETGKISEEEFDERETELLDRLDAIRGQEAFAEDEDEDEQDAADDI